MRVYALLMETGTYSVAAAAAAATAAVTSVTAGQAREAIDEQVYIDHLTFLSAFSLSTHSCHYIYMLTEIRSASLLDHCGAS